MRLISFQTMILETLVDSPLNLADMSEGYSSRLLGSSLASSIMLRHLP